MVEVNRLGYDGQLFSDRWKAGTYHAEKWTNYDALEVSSDVGLAVLAVVFLLAPLDLGLGHFLAALVDLALFLAVGVWTYNLILTMALGFT